MGVLKNFAFMMAFISVSLLSSCGSSSSTTTSLSTTTTTEKGAVAIYLTDAPANYSAVYVTIAEIAVHQVSEDSTEEDNNSAVLRAVENEESNTSESEDNASDEDASWRVVATPNKTFNLLELQDGVLESLGVTELEAGKYTQVRLILADAVDDNGTNMPYAHYVVLDDNSTEELKVPSSVIKLNHPFDVEEGKTTNLVIDFDAEKSVNPNVWSLKPVISLDTPEDINESKVISDEDNETQE